MTKEQNNTNKGDAKMVTRKEMAQSEQQIIASVICKSGITRPVDGMRYRVNSATRVDLVNHFASVHDSDALPDGSLPTFEVVVEHRREYTTCHGNTQVYYRSGRRFRVGVMQLKQLKAQHPSINA